MEAGAGLGLLMGPLGQLTLPHVFFPSCPGSLSTVTAANPHQTRALVSSLEASPKELFTGGDYHVS